jgi:DNA adenine methylase
MTLFNTIGQNQVVNVASVPQRSPFRYPGGKTWIIPRLMQSDGMDILRKYSDRNDTVFFIDPPYTAAGKKAGSRLYRHFELNHEELFETASKLSSDFLMTYDDNDMIQSLAQRYGFDMQVISMKNTHHATMKELLIAPHLDWLRFS